MLRQFPLKSAVTYRHWHINPTNLPEGSLGGPVECKKHKQSYCDGSFHTKDGRVALNNIREDDKPLSKRAGPGIRMDFHVFIHFHFLPS